MLKFQCTRTSSPEGGTGSFLTRNTFELRVYVRYISLGDFAHDSSAPEGIKFDVEGAEVEELCGAESTLRTHHPGVFREIHTAEIRESCAIFSNIRITPVEQRMTFIFYASA
jgi:FkbM family methyltransferase